MARDKFQFNLGDEIHVISDKAFRVTSENTFEAIGNVIIKFGSNSIYSEKAKINFSSGEIKVEGNVRYISTELTMYGTHLYYNTKKKVVRIQNARILSDNFIILGKELTKYSDNRLTGKDAEYTTCKDCPESWSVFGKEIDVTVGEYVQIKHSYFKTKGVVLMYVPYIIFPIKKERETGLLFPQTSFNFADGVKFQVPFFWAISDNKDLTLTPSLWGKRGVGGELEYRHYLTERDWFEVRSLFANDRVYEPFKIGYEPAEKSTFRNFVDYEHHFSKGLFFNHHLSVNLVKDLDMIRDFDFYSSNRVDGSEIGAEGFLDFRTSHFNLAIDSEFKRNLLVTDPRGFDHTYVQVLPRVSFSSLPFNLINTDYFGLNSFSVGIESDFNIFKQNHVQEDNYVRNAKRLSLLPYYNWNLGNIEGINLNSHLVFDYQTYELPTENEKNYYKHAFIHKTTASIEFERIFGIAYEEIVPLEEVTKKEKEEEIINNNKLVGKLPKFSYSAQKETTTISKNSYRHSQIFELNHYLLTGLGNGGNDSYHLQLQNENGQFDIDDFLREKEFEAFELGSETTLPLRNTIEIQWRNSLIEKTAKKFNYNDDYRYLKQNFNYKKIAYFNVSQGYNMDIVSDTIREKLTRLYVTTGISFSDFSLAASEYYFYKNQKHVFKIDLERWSPIGKVGTTFIYDSQITPINKSIEVWGNIMLIDTTKLYARYAYDIEDKLVKKSLYGIEYSPENDCWKSDLSYTADEIEKRISFNFMIKFNDKNFKSLSGK